MIGANRSEKRYKLDCEMEIISIKNTSADWYCCILILHQRTMAGNTLIMVLSLFGSAAHSFRQACAENVPGNPSLGRKRVMRLWKWKQETRMSISKGETEKGRCYNIIWWKSFGTCYWCLLHHQRVTVTFYSAVLQQHLIERVMTQITWNKTC